MRNINNSNIQGKTFVILFRKLRTSFPSNQKKKKDCHHLQRGWKQLLSRAMTESTTGMSFSSVLMKVLSHTELAVPAVRLDACSAFCRRLILVARAPSTGGWRPTLELRSLASASAIAPTLRLAAGWHLISRRLAGAWRRTISRRVATYLAVGCRH